MADREPPPLFDDEDQNEVKTDNVSEVSTVSFPFRWMSKLPSIFVQLIKSEMCLYTI